MESLTPMFDYSIRLVVAVTPLVLGYMTYIFNKKLKEQDVSIKERYAKIDEENKKRDELRKKMDDEREERYKKFISENIEDLKVKVVNMEITLTNHVEDTDFRLQFQDAIRNKSRQNILTLTNFLNQQFKNKNVLAKLCN